MNGPEHYREAERLIWVGECVAEEIRSAEGDEARRDALGKQAMGVWAQAQVHATLAQVAATIDSRGYGAFQIRNNDAWDRVLGHPDGASTAGCTDTSDCPSPVHATDCPARRGTR